MGRKQRGVGVYVIPVRESGCQTAFLALMIAAGGGCQLLEADGAVLPVLRN